MLFFDISVKQINKMMKSIFFALCVLAVAQATTFSVSEKKWWQINLFKGNILMENILFKN